MKQYKTYKSTCCYCGVGCGVTIKKHGNSQLVVEGDADHPVNKGMLCSKGVNLHYTVMDQSDRLLHPQMRMSRNSSMMQVSWNRAMEMTAAKFKSFINEYGPDSVAFYVSGQCLTEEYYLANKLMKGFIGSNNIDTNSRLCMSSAVAGYKLSLGEDAVPNSYEDIELADCFFITGANPAWCHPILYRRIEAHKLANPNVKIIIADPRRTQSCDLADIHLQLKPGTDVVLNHALGRCLIEMNHIDKHFIEHHTEGFEQYKAMVMKRSIEEAASICDVAVYDIVKAAEYIGEAKGYVSLWTMGLNQSVIGVNKNLSLINLSLITGKIGKPGNGPFSLTGQPNAMGGREVGGLCNLLPNHRDLTNPEHRKYVQQFWGGTEIQSTPGLSATEMFDALEDGKLKAIWIICTNPIVSMPNSRKVEKALLNAEFVVVQDISNRSETLKFADVILPAATWAEKEGTMTNSERRISYLAPVVSPPGEALPDSEILIRFAHKLGFGNAFNYKNNSEVFSEHCRLSKGTYADISGLSYDILKEKGSVQWPFISENSKGTKRLFSDHLFYTSSKRAIIRTVADVNESESVNENYPLILTTGRIRDQWHTMTKTGKVQRLQHHISEPFLELHPQDAAVRNVNEGDLVEVNGRRGNVRVKAKISHDIKPGVVFLPMHWGKNLHLDLGRVNNITAELFDATSKQPDLKFSAVEVIKYIKPHQKIVVIGAGAGAYGFITSYRKYNTVDEITVFSDEPHSFYNRVLLPDYVSGSRAWSHLLKMDHEDENIFNINLHKGTSIVNIDKDSKIIFDSNGKEYSYDILIMCTGSNAATLQNVPIELRGTFTMRNRGDAERLIPYSKKGNRIIIIGGGLLGLELAGALREKEVDVTVIHRGVRLMDKQLDNTGSQLLHEELVEIGIKILYGQQLQTVFGKECISGITLTNGKYLECDAMIAAVGTVPNIRLANEAGLDCNTGVIVNQFLQTSDQSIYAIGEIAEFNGTLCGITSAAEDQAEILATHISGNGNVYYEGSVPMNILKIKGIDVCSIGMVKIPDDNSDYEEIVFADKAKRVYKKCIVHNDRLVGAILIGDKTEFLEFKTLLKNKIELSEKRSQLLRSSQRAEAVEGQLICSCNNVGMGNITNKIRNGISDFDLLCSSTGAGTGCGSCRPEVRKILRQEISVNETRELMPVIV